MKQHEKDSYIGMMNIHLLRPLILLKDVLNITNINLKKYKLITALNLLITKRKLS